MNEPIVCSRCIHDSTIAGIEFDHEGVCSHCRQIDALAGQYGTCKQ